ncbi:MAG TPA: glycosyltransferase [Pyrinomonadaceae bacterium]|jgi:glycosyltransferase involved in cell wall biosynthesis
MRILHISSARALGGGERHLAGLLEGLVVRGHEVYAALSHASLLGAELKKVPDANVLRLPLRNALDAPSALRLARFVRARRIEIVHAHLARDYPLAALASRLAPGSKLFITRHVLFPLGRVHSLVLRRAARILAVSGAVERALRAQRLFPTDKIRTVQNGIDIERFERAARGFDRTEFRRRLGASARLVVGTVGELSNVKGQEDFLRAAALVVRALGDGVGFLVVGEDASRDGQRRAALGRLVAELGIGERLRLLGRMEDVAPLLHALDLYVSASRSEAFGLAIVEAMACGLAVVATATEGAREIVEDGETGRLVGVGNVDALAESILALLANPSERERLGAQARASARERFSLVRMIEATEKLYLEALGEK